MSIVLYHARVDERILAALQTRPERFWELPEDADPAGNQLLYTDKDWSALCWLLSAKAREEQKHDVVMLALGWSNAENLVGSDAWEAAKAQEAAKRGFKLVDAGAMPDDPVLTAIQGRGPRDGRFPQVGYGARTFVSEEVTALSAALDRITEADLREHFDPQVMQSLDVAGIL